MIKALLNFAVFVLLLFLNFSCNSKQIESENGGSWELILPTHFPALPVPIKNEMNLAKISLGNYLFYDKALSKDSSTSCASCHLPELAFSDGRSKSIGIGDSIGMRNAPVLFNIAYASSYMMDGGVPTLELQVIAPLMHEGEMGFDLFELEKRFSTKKLYQGLAMEAFDRKLDAAAIAYSLAAFQRSILSYESKFDAYKSGKTEVFTASELKGYELFYSDSLNCSACHIGVNFSDYNFYNIGLYNNYKDKGRARVTEQVEDNGKFKVPNLRNIEFTAPYMHDGSIASLEELINFKMTGGCDHENKSDIFKSFYLDAEAKIALIAFLKTLSDPIFIEREVKRRKK
jgi:cytochrome c peroxidase